MEQTTTAGATNQANSLREIALSIASGVGAGIGTKLAEAAFGNAVGPLAFYSALSIGIGQSISGCEKTRAKPSEYVLNTGVVVASSLVTCAAIDYMLNCFKI